jgi:hypothetical protein
MVNPSPTGACTALAATTGSPMAIGIIIVVAAATVRKDMDCLLRFLRR